MILCVMLLCSIVHSIICTRLFRGKMHSDWFNGIEILQGRWQHGEQVIYSFPSGLEKTLCNWDIYVPLVTKVFSIFLCYPEDDSFESKHVTVKHNFQEIVVLTDNYTL
jgi:hypothetical protein